ncbi:MAG: hypothetical protein AB7O31_18155 [Burkholderiales bacterium]
MSRKSEPRKLTLKLDGRHITAERFVKAVSSFVALINEVSEAVTNERGAFRWIVSVESGSAIVHFQPEPQHADAMYAPVSVKAINDGFELLEARAERPRYWSDVALRKAKDLAEVLEPAGGTLDHVSVRSDRKERSVTPKLGAHVDALIGSDYRSLGSIEGRLRAINEAGGVHFVIRDPATNNEVRCYFQEEDADEYMKAWRKRVSVYGEIRYRKDGTPVSVSVREFRVLREAAELPKARDVRGILAS